MTDLVSVVGTVKPGHRVASGMAEDSPYEQGTLAMQQLFFADLGLDISGFYLGTLNISIAPYSYKMNAPEYTFPDVKWHPQYPAETFSFTHCQLVVRDYSYDGLIYYPHPETKIGHFQDDSILEAIAPKILNLTYGDCLTLKVNPQAITILKP